MAGERISSEQGENTATSWDTLSEMPSFEESKRLSFAEEAVAKVQADFERQMDSNRQFVEKTKAGIVKLEAKMAAEPEEWRKERYAQQIANRKDVLASQEAFVDFARVPSVEDVEERAWAKKDFAGAVSEAVPEELPLVFHGSNNIGVIRQIIQTHGLLTPDQRGVSMKSFATQIDVTTKNNIQTSCDFAESGKAWMPYGAIFAFMPREDEVGKVRDTLGGSEVFGGVKGVDFKEEPERLYGIITTTENIDRLQDWCKEAGLDESKVMTHRDFLENMRETQE